MNDTGALDAGLVSEAKRIAAEFAGMAPCGVGTWTRGLWEKAIYAALRAAEVRGEERMRERAAEVAVDSVRPTSRPPFDITAEFHNAVLDEIGADIAEAIRALPTADKETTHG